ncbi:polysaccharide lyase [Actinomycetospora aeridis]|uniref:Polysaccharide lyase n=1 Tax=Actinomycetospora aeridis TaxID=3129231 RepID=A0ABU8N6T0_9PSEU
MRRTHVATRGPRRLLSARSGRLAVVLALLSLLVPVLAAPVASAAPPPTDERPIWVLPESGDMLAGFGRSDYDEQDGTPRQVPAPEEPGRQAIEFTVEGGGQRSEMRPRIPDQVEGDVQYYTYGAQLAPDFPTDARTWQLLFQWHHYGDSGSPPVAVEVRENRLMLAAEGENLTDLGPVRAGDRVDLTLRIAFSRDPDRGTVDVWRDGRPVLEDYRPPGGTLLDGGNYMKVGLYRDTDVDEEGRVYLDDLRIGPSLASVQRPGSASSSIENATDPGEQPASPADGASDVAPWIAAFLLLIVAGAAVAAVSRRRTRR